MESYRGGKRAYQKGNRPRGGHFKGFAARLFKQTIGAGIILLIAAAVSSSQSPAAQSAAQYMKNAVNYSPDISWAVESINAFFGKKDAEKSGEDGAEPVSAEENNEETLE